MQGINRTLLSWLKLWDEVVFGCPVAVNSRPITSHKGEEKGNVKKIQQRRKSEIAFEYQNPNAFSGSEVTC